MRRQAGQDAIPFHKFADLIKTQVAQMKEKGTPEVAFRVAMKDGKVRSHRPGDERPDGPKGQTRLKVESGEVEKREVRSEE